MAAQESLLARFGVGDDDRIVRRIHHVLVVGNPSNVTGPPRCVPCEENTQSKPDKVSKSLDEQVPKILLSLKTLGPLHRSLAGQ